MGLLNEQMPQEAPQEQPQAQGQEQYTAMMTMMLDWLYSEQGVQAIQEGLQMSEEPAESIGTIVARLIQKLFTDAKQAGKSIPPMMIVQGAIELSQAVTDMAMSAGLVDEQSANQVAKNSFYEAMTIAGNDIPPDAFAEGERQQFEALLAQIDAMDQEYEGSSQSEQPPQEQPQEQPQQNPEMMRG